MSEKCQTKCGFFVIQSCPNPAVKQCESCGKGACQPHLLPNSGYKLCVSCGKKAPQKELFSNYSGQSEQEEEYYNDYWIYSYRSQYYGQGYRPFMFSRQDYSSFENYDDNSDDWDDNYVGDFNDS